ncbi:hypothetical protein CEXT_345161 [Caerostris extrusa]|uniref:Uncharacterized protein n=1 Tax=Caerostris extrusa TaxID=172846 RepID=A0AAV4PPJ1_CAEEX|nr:hypothetical protein CEXT_345161 [Caerostris extrusa]
MGRRLPAETRVSYNLTGEDMKTMMQFSNLRDAKAIYQLSGTTGVCLCLDISRSRNNMVREKKKTLSLTNDSIQTDTVVYKGNQEAVMDTILLFLSI